MYRAVFNAKIGSMQYLEMTEEEIAKLKQEAENVPKQEPTDAERIAALEDALNLLLSGATE